MTYLVKFRALCDNCEGAEAQRWCVQDRCALCYQCDEKVHRGNRVLQRHERVDVARSSVLSALCSRCSVAPAAFLHERVDAALCELCDAAARQEEPPRGDSRLGPPSIRTSAGGGGGGSAAAVPLKEAPIAQSFVFDRMDFTSSLAARRPRRTAGGGGGGGGGASHARSAHEETAADKVDRWLNADEPRAAAAAVRPPPSASDDDDDADEQTEQTPPLARSRGTKRKLVASAGEADR